MKANNPRGQAVRLPPLLLSRADAAAEKLIILPGEKPSRHAVIRHALTIGLDALESGGVNHGRV
jgi:hypothetical protein